MANTTKIVRNSDEPIILDKESVEFIFDKIQVLKEVSILEFQDDDKDDESRLDWAQTIIDCDNILIYLKQKLI